MEVFVVSEPVDFERVDDERSAYLIRQWAMIYTYFDETTWGTQRYLYRFSKHDDADARQALLESYGIQVEQQWRFVWAHSDDSDCIDFSLIESKEEMITVLFGVAVVYWSWKYGSDWTTLEKIDITIPNSAEFQEPWRQLVEMIDMCRWVVGEQYLWVSVDAQWSDAAYCTVTISDRVVLEYFLELQWDDDTQVPAWDRVIHYLNMLLDDHASAQIEELIHWNEVRLLKIQSKSL